MSAFPLEAVDLEECRAVTRLQLYDTQPFVQSSVHPLYSPSASHRTRPSKGIILYTRRAELPCTQAGKILRIEKHRPWFSSQCTLVGAPTLWFMAPRTPKVHSTPCDQVLACKLSKCATVEGSMPPLYTHLLCCSLLLPGNHTFGTNLGQLAETPVDSSEPLLCGSAL